jgi:beta-N-acetylhexosaminidase
MTITSAQPLGPLVIDIEGHALTAADAERLTHPLVGGVILFTRNYRDRQQLTELCAEIHALRKPRLLIAIDHEGGRVQRCRDDFSVIPAMRKLGILWDIDAAGACQTALSIGYLLAAELRQCDVDFSFTPVLDLDWGRSGVIGDRSFHRNPQAVIELAGALINGLHSAGMHCCGKHFPGHGWVTADSHTTIPVDERVLADMSDDLIPYRHLALDAIMPAHVIYPQVDSHPAGFSPVWISKLRNEFAFDGIIFSDDLSMEGASVAGNIIDRANAAWTAGCDALLVCNAPNAVDVLLKNWQPEPMPDNIRPLSSLLPNKPWQRDERHYALGIAAIQKLTSDIA